MKKISLHPYLITISFILVYYVGLKAPSPKWEIIPICIIGVAISFSIFKLIYFFNKQFYKSAILTSCSMLVLVNLDGIYEILINEKSFLFQFRVFLTTIIGQYAIFFLGVLGIIILGFLLLKIKNDLQPISVFMDFSTVALVILITFQMVATVSSNSESGITREDKTQELWSAYSKQVIDGLPKETNFTEDIYYIVLDGYGDQEVIADLCGNDSYLLATRLSDLGFLVIRDAKTNYNQTRFSISSALNFSYIQDLQSAVDVSGDDTAFPILLINQNMLFQFLRQVGYKTITFRTPFDQINVHTSNYYIAPPLYPSPFIEVLVNNTFLSLFFWKTQYIWHSLGIENILDEINNLQKIDKPIFVYAHLLIPHPPFVFSSDGRITIPEKKYDLRDNNEFVELDNRQTYIDGYCDQVSFINVRINTIVSQLILDSPDAVIIIQGDHGPGADFFQDDYEKSDLNQKFHILNAIYFPDQEYQLLSDDVTPVNTFRVILNKYFNSTSPLLENRTFYSGYSNIYDFIDITDQLR